MSLKLGKFGAFIGCSNYPECKFTRTLADTNAETQSATATGRASKCWASIPQTGDEITLRDGRFGAYVQQGEGEKPKRSSLPKTIAPADVTLEQAIGASEPAARGRASSRDQSSRSLPASAATGLMSSTARPTPISARTTTF